jgi:hypothetical protein
LHRKPDGGKAALQRAQLICSRAAKECAMGSRNSRRRQAKAIRRKNLLAERRRRGTVDGRESLAEMVRRASAAPLHSCLLQKEMFESGVGTMILIRKTAARRAALAGFLVDRYCLGVKDAMFREIDEGEIETVVEQLGTAEPFEPVDPSYARKLLRDAVAYARSLGLEPPADYAAIEPLFGDVAADACEVEFEFGFEGKPLYVPGPAESLAQIRRRVDLLRRRLGADGFVFGEIEDDSDLFEDESDIFEESDDEDEDADVEGGYDPNVAPDPEQWLALPEQERSDLVLGYHRQAGVSLPNEQIHAVFHVIVENQIALGDELPVRRAVDRLMAEGLDRHQAIHAAASVLSGQLSDDLRDPATRTFSTEAYKSALERLTVESWRRDYGQKDEDEDEEDED